jgi:hypothetical protein
VRVLRYVWQLLSAKHCSECPGGKMSKESGVPGTHLGKVLRRAGPAAGNDRDGHGLGHGIHQRQVKALGERSLTACLTA